MRVSLSRLLTMLVSFACAAGCRPTTTVVPSTIASVPASPVITSTTTSTPEFLPSPSPRSVTPANTQDQLTNVDCPDTSWDILTTAKQKSISQVFLVNSQTGETNQLTYGKQSSLAMSWSPDGCEILMLSQAGNTQEYSEIVKLNLATRKTAPIASIKALESFPKWSPDGSLIAFAKTIENVGQIFVMDADGHDVRQVTFGSLPAAVLEWSPDSQVVAYVLRPEIGRAHV
jgi:Tol biopolymer transport system component